MEVNVRYLKGVRTRFRNTLEKEIQNSSSILSSNIELLEREIHVDRISVCAQKIKTYMDKLEIQTEKVASALTESDSEYMELMLEEDFALQAHAVDCHLNLKQLKDTLMTLKPKEETSEGPTEQVTSEHLLHMNQEVCF